MSNLMLLPTLACQGRCNYCFGPRGNGKTMSTETLDAALNWMRRGKLKNGIQKQEVVFHGGEPLTVGPSFYRQALPRLRQMFGSDQLRIAVQSNLWLLTDELCEIFLEYGVSLGTSLDGPVEITDAQRGDGYFQRTMGGIELARRRGLKVGCICTFTPLSASRYNEVLDFFASRGLDFSVHAAVPPLELSANTTEKWSLPPHDFGELLVDMLDSYIEKIAKVRISTLDSLCRSISAGKGGTCTFLDCLGQYLAVAPDGGIYPCQRFAGQEQFCVGNVKDQPSQEQLEKSLTWRAFRQREESVATQCGDCVHFSHCRGGCPYDALAAGNGVFHDLRDPYCQAYKRIFSYMTDKALAEVFSDENMEAVLADPDGESLLRKGPLLTLMRGGPHPAETARRARELLSAVAIAHSPDLCEAAARLDAVGLVTDRVRAADSLGSLRRNLDKRPDGLLNLYLHVTYDCNLGCSHCYAESGPDRAKKDGVMSVKHLELMTKEASSLKFRKVVITGGEPLMHPSRDAMLEALADLRESVKPARTVLRTNLSVPMDLELLRRIAVSTDQVVVSIDGDRASHDSRRGEGSYDRTVANLRALIDSDPSAEVSLLAVLTSDQTAGREGKAVRALADERGGLQVRFKPLLPLGRARDNDPALTPDVHWASLKRHELLTYGFRPLTSCGVGYSLYVAPDGAAYPCYALVGGLYYLGNVFGEGGLRGVIESEKYRRLARHTVDTNRMCQSCVLRYLCGGSCRAWTCVSRDAGSESVPVSLDDPPFDCSPLQARAAALLLTALETINISPQQWVDAGFPLPEASLIGGRKA